MAFDPTITTWITGFVVDSAQANITIPISTFDELTAAEVDSSAGGDIRKFLFAFSDELFEKWNATATADRPSNMTINKTVSSDVSAGTATETYTFRFVTQSSAREVVDEA